MCFIYACAVSAHAHFHFIFCYMYSIIYPYYISASSFTLFTFVHKSYMMIHAYMHILCVVSRQRLSRALVGAGRGMQHVIC